MVDLPNNGLLPASFRGVPFVVTNDEIGVGRRQAVHQYPGRDEPWAEDMGREARRFRFRGFIADGSIRFSGGPIQLQRVLLLAALEKKGPGLLTHPTLGLLNVSVARASVGQDLGAGRMSSVDVEFVESGKRSFPSLLSSGSGILSAATLCKVALAVDLVRVVGAVIGAGGSSGDLKTTAAAWASQVTALGHDATALTKLAVQLPGNFGRYADGGNQGFSGTTASPYSGDTTIADLVAAASQQRVVIAAASAALPAVIDELGATTDENDLANAAIAILAALLGSCADPADAMRLLLSLISFSVNLGAGGALAAAMNYAFRRAVAAALATASGQYQPSSYDDAAAIMAAVSGAIDAVAVESADAGDDASYEALTAMRVQVVTDLRARGALLARVRTITFGDNLPALMLAQRLYQDPTRADQLVNQAAPRHPLFMPTTFQALAA